MIISESETRQSWLRVSLYNGPIYGSFTCPLIVYIKFTIRGLNQAMNTSCVICSGTSACFKCQINYLTQQLNKYKEREVKSERKLLKQYPISVDMLKKISDVKRSELPIDICISTEQSIDYRFLTITFDPQKFGSLPMEDFRKQYILKSLLSAYDIQLIKDFYGCFEYHSNGLIHSHIMVNIRSSDIELYDYMRPLFTDNKKNIRAVVILPYTNKTINYINKIETPNKRSTDFFWYDRPIQLDYSTEPTELFNKNSPFYESGQTSASQTARHGVQASNGSAASLSLAKKIALFNRNEKLKYLKISNFSISI